NGVLWQQVGDATYGQPADLFLGAWTFVMWVCVGGGLLLALVAAARSGDTPATAPREPAAGAGRADLVVCCSGGGIRAASFCLGGLQALKSHYGRADAVVGVSGGGYMAAAHHVLRWCSSNEEEGEWADLDPRAYAPDSPEEK